jgi:parallel beta-helix repeat protein
MKKFFMQIMACGAFVGVLTLMGDVNDYSLPILFRGDVSPANAAYTINRSGVYKLTSAKTASGVPNISITANNVTLDLGGNTLTGGTNGIEITGNNVTVKNGAISGMTQNGVLIQGSSCRVENCDVVASPTGITLQNSNQCVVENCRVRNMTQTGVSLQSTWTSSVRGCEISGVHGVGSVYGTLAHNGGNNTFEQCTLRDLQTNSSTGSDKVVGSALSGEAASTLSGNTIQAVESLTTVSAYGVWIDGGNNAVLNDNSIAQVTTSNNVGVGVFVNQSNSYVASNVCYDCDSSFTGVSPQFIDSQANARGVDNIDTNLTTPDQIEVISNDQLPPIESQVDLLSPVFDSLESRVDSLSGCADIPVSAPGTLSTSGSYCLADTINGTLSITGTDISLCMNEHTVNGGMLSISGDRVMVSNGTVRNNSVASGVYVTGNNCFFNNIRSIANQTGFELSGCQNNMVSNCSAISCSREGFLLNNSTRNYVADCTVQSLVGTGTVAGIKTTNGTSNKITGCTVNGVSTTNGDAYGMWGNTEKKSIILDNTFNDVSATGGVVKGISLEQDAHLSTAVSFEWSFSLASIYQSRAMDWVSVDPRLAYLAISADNSTSLKIFRFDEPDTLNLCYEHSFAYIPRMVQWLRIKDTFYLAVGFTGSTFNDIRIFIFDRASESLLELPNAVYTYDAAVIGNAPLSSRWLVYPDGRIFIMLCGSGGQVQVLSFDGDRLLLDQKATVVGDVLNADWCLSGSHVLLAVPTNRSASQADLYIYDFDVNNNTLTMTTTVGLDPDNSYSSQWLAYNEKLYLAVSCYTPVNNKGVIIMNYDTATNTLTALTDKLLYYTSMSDWLVVGSTIYVAFATSSNPRVYIYTFNPQGPTLTLFKSYGTTALGFGGAQYLQWFTGVQGRAILGIACASSSSAWRAFDIVGFDVIGSTTTLLQNNTVSNIVGTGISADCLSDNIFENKVYNATTSYNPSKPFNFDPSNNNGIAYS